MCVSLADIIQKQREGIVFKLTSWCHQGVRSWIAAIFFLNDAFAPLTFIGLYLTSASFTRILQNIHSCDK